MSWGVVVALAAAGSALLIAAGVTRATQLVLWGIAALGTAYAVVLPAINVTTAAVTAPLVAGGLFVAAEGVFLAAGRGAVPKPDPSRAATWLTAAGLGAIATSALVLLLATVAIGRSLLVTIVGTVAAVIVVAMLSGRSQGDRPDG